MKACSLCGSGLPKPESNWGTPEHPVCERCSNGFLPDITGKYALLRWNRRRSILKREQAYFGQFAGETLVRLKCDNCGAKFLAEPSMRFNGPGGRTICCAHCLFNHLGCRCQYGQYGVAETYVDDFYDGS